MYIKVRVQAGAKKEKLTKISNDHFEVAVREKAEMNQANQRILELFRTEFKDKIVKLVSGHHSPHKILNIEDRE